MPPCPVCLVLPLRNLLGWRDFLLPDDSATVVPCGGLVPGVAVSADVSGTLWEACPLCRPPTLPLVCCFAPYPPNPLPRRGRGRILLYFAGGFAPGTPALNRLRHLLSLPRGRGPSQTPPSLATDSSISPGPPSPWLPALPVGKPFCRFCGEPWVQPWGCKGRSPLHKKTKSLPLPAGKSALRARVGGISFPFGEGG